MSEPDKSLSSSTTSVSELELLCKHIEQNSQTQHLMELALKRKPLASESESFGKYLRSLFIASAEDFYGKVIVTDALKKQAALTANVNTVANLVDFVSNFPFYFFSFQFLGIVPAAVLGFILDLGILYFSNYTSTVASNRNKKNLSWAKSGAMGLILISTIKSLVSGVGVELLNNRAGLNQQLAAQLIEKQIQQIESLKQIDSPRYSEAKKRCQAGSAELNNLPRHHPRWDSLYSQLYGSWGDKERDWSKVTLAKLPICHQVMRLQKEAYHAYEIAKTSLEKKLSRRVAIGNDLIFLKAETPEVYQLAFTPSGEIDSGVEAVRVATQNFFGKLLTGQFASLGFSLFFFSLSLVTSAAAVLMTLKYADREDVQMSWDEFVKEERDRWLHRIWEESVEKAENRK